VGARTAQGWAPEQQADGAERTAPGGDVNPRLREIAELAYLWTGPYVLDTRDLR
jgi:hypothetical protein